MSEPIYTKRRRLPPAARGALGGFATAALLTVLVTFLALIDHREVDVAQAAAVATVLGLVGALLGAALSALK
jgi:hypothetical protein